MSATITAPALIDSHPRNRLTEQEIAAFVQRMTHDAYYYAGAERRSQRRYALAVAVPAEPLDEMFSPAGKPFTAVSRDLSIAGISLYHTQPVRQRYLALELTACMGDKLRAVIDVNRCRRVGFLYEIAGAFLTS